MSITKLTSDLRNKPLLFSVLFALGSLRPLGAEQPNANDRLVATGKLWATIEYFHPSLAAGTVDWDKALIDHLPAIQAAKDSTSYGDAIEAMLEALHDPATYVVHQSPPTNPGLHWERKPDGAVVVSEIENGAKQTTTVGEVIQQSNGIVFDLRMPGNKSSDYLADLIDEALDAGLDLPGERAWIHHGLPSFSGFDPDLFYAAYAARPGIAARGPASFSKQFAFILGEQDKLPKAALALWRNGRARVFADAIHFRIAGTRQVEMEAGEDVRVNLRLSEPEFSDGSSFGEPVRVAPEKAIDAALDSIRKKADPQPVALKPLPSPRKDSSYGDMPFPALAYRILASFKIWGAFRYFFAYRDLMDEDWDAIFAEYLPKLMNATDARAYHLAAAEMVTHVDDTHSAVHSPILDDYFGRATAPVRIALVERRPIVTEVFGDALNADIHVGDVIVSVDGEETAARIKRIAQYISGSTQQSLRHEVMNVILSGADGSTAALSVRDEEGQQKEVSLKRTVANCAPREQRTGDVVRLLAGDIGYVDLDRLRPEQVDETFERLKAAKAIIFDMRGTPHVKAEALASHLTNKTDVAGAILTGPLAFTPDVAGQEKLTDTSSYFFVQTFAPSHKPPFAGKTIMLTDERTSAEGERIGLFLEAANNTTFIGDVSAGAVTSITDFVVPGGITVTLSGVDVRHGNAGKLQRLGLQTAVSVPASVRAIRSRKDEVLEKAIAYLSQ